MANSYFCPICNKTLSKANKSRHLKTCAKDDSFAIPCPICTDKYDRTDVLTLHIKNKHKDVKSRCRFCDSELGGIPTIQEEFPSTSTLVQHMKQHHSQNKVKMGRPQKRKQISANEPLESIKHAKIQENPTTVDMSTMGEDDYDRENQENIPTTSKTSSNEDIMSTSRDMDTTTTTDHSTDSDSGQSNCVPIHALQSPPHSPDIVDDVPADYDWDNELPGVIPALVEDKMLEDIPLGAHDIVRNNWSRICSRRHEPKNCLSWYYNQRLIDARENPDVWFHRAVHERQKTAYRVQASLAFLLQNIETKEFKVFYSSQNNFGLQINVPNPQENDNKNQPYLINNETTLNNFLSHLNWHNFKEFATTLMPDTKWKMINILNVSYWVYNIYRPVGCSDCNIPDHLNNNRHVETFLYDTSRNKYKYHLCLFRILVYVLEDGSRDNNLAKKYFEMFQNEVGGTMDLNQFQGVEFNDLEIIERLFKVHINAYQIHDDGLAYKIRTGLKHCNSTRIDVDMSQQKECNTVHFSLITNIDKYSKCWYCPFCDKRFRKSNILTRHIKNASCNRGQTKRVFPGGIHEEPPNIFDQLESVGCKVRSKDDIKQYCQYRTVYDFESCLRKVTFKKSETLQKPIYEMENVDTIKIGPFTDKEIVQGDVDEVAKYHMEVDENTPTAKTQFFQSHEPISFSIMSNVPGYNTPYTIIEPDSNKLLKDFVDHLEKISEACHQLQIEYYSEEISAMEQVFNEAKQAYKTKLLNDDSTTLSHCWLKKVNTIRRAFMKWLKQLVVIGYNSGRYDINLIKESLYPILVERAQQLLNTKAEKGDYDRRMANILGIKIYQKCRKATVKDMIPEKQPTARQLKKLIENEFFDMETSVCNRTEEEEEEEEEAEDAEEEEEPQDVEEAKTQLERMQKLYKRAKEVLEPIPKFMNYMPNVIKNGRNILSLNTENLIFLDMIKYLGGGSLNEFMQAWKSSDEIRKGNGLPPDEHGFITMEKLPFPYSFLDSPSKLDHEGVPERSAFNEDHLNGGHISDEDYSKVVELYHIHNIKTFRDYLRIYNEADCIPFLQAVNKHFDIFFSETGIDLFKEAVSLPGITLKFLQRNTKNYNFSLWRYSEASLHDSFRQQMTGGLSQVNTRKVIVGETVIREQEMGKSSKEFHKAKTIIGYDFNALYLWALAQDMPVGWYTHWEHLQYSDRIVAKSTGKPKAQQWLDSIAHSENINIISKYTCGFEKRLGPFQINVDGFCEQNNTVYEFLGCYWHTHRPCDCKGRMPTDKNEQTGKTADQCEFELEERRRYVESLGKKFVCIWECEWDTSPEQNIFKRGNRFWEDRVCVNHAQAVRAIRKGNLYGFCKIDIETPSHLQEEPSFRDLPPIIKNAIITREHLSPHMLDHCKKFDLLKKGTKCLVSAFGAQAQWFSTNMIQYFIKLGLKVTKIHDIIQYERAQPFKWFADLVTLKRSAADVNPTMIILGNAFKLLGNTGYGKTITCVDKHLDVCLLPTHLAKEAINDPFCVSMEYIADDCYEVVMKKRKIKYKLPEQIGICTYNNAKIRMLEFNYDFLGTYLDSQKYMWIQTDTDSVYLALSEDTIEECIKPEMRDKFEKEKHKWFVQSKADKRTPGLMKEEYKDGTKMIALGCKMYQSINKDDERKYATKGLKASNQISFEVFEEVLVQGKAGTSKGAHGFNTGFAKAPNGKIGTYISQKDAINYMYIKRKVNEDGVTTEPILDI